MDNYLDQPGDHPSSLGTKGGIAMTREEFLKRISSDPNVCFGKPVILGTRIWVSLILGFLADGMKEEDILDEYPQLKPEDIRACLVYAAFIANERTIPLA